MLFITVLTGLRPAYARAADANSFLQSYYTEEGKVIVYCASLADIGETYTAQQFTAAVSGQDCPVLEVAETEETEGITFYCLVDVSGSMHQEQMEQARDVLTEICENLNEKDNMVIGALGTTLETTEFLTDKEELRAVIDALSADSEYTAIYDAVIDSISVLQSNNNCNRKKCLVIISDGDDETVIGKTRDEVWNTIEKSKIPVYTVAALRQSYNEQQKQSAEALGAFARQSAGGRAYAPVAEGFSAKDAGKFIVEDNREGLVLTIDTSGVEPAKDELLLNVQLKTDSATYTDTMYLYAADLQFAPTEQTVPEETGSSAETSADGEESGKGETSVGDEEGSIASAEDGQKDAGGIPVYLLLLAGGAVLVLLLAAVLFLRKKKAKEAEEKEAAEKEAKERADAERADKDKADKARAGKAQNASAQGGKGLGAAASYEVQFIAIGHEGIVFTLHIPEGKTLTLGRNKKADLVLNPEDRHLSSVQCKVHCMQNVMNVWDMNSQNGTFVNGVPIRKIGMATVQNGDVMRMGSYEYRIMITKK